jgi:hypothetical protein
MTIPEDMDATHFMILDDWRISTKKIAQTLEISRETVGYIIHELLDMRKLSAKWVSKFSMLVRSMFECSLHKPSGPILAGSCGIF